MTVDELKKNQVYIVRIEGYADNGAGVARIGGRVVFVQGALMGETCEILILKVNARSAFAGLSSLMAIRSRFRRRPAPRGTCGSP